MRMKMCLLVFLTGCAPAIEAELGLIAQSRRGVALVDRSMVERDAAAADHLAAQRKRLEAAFDEDVMAQESLTADWVISARQAYAAMIDALNLQEGTARRSLAVDRSNLRAVDAALEQLDTLNRAQLKLSPEKVTHEDD